MCDYNVLRLQKDDLPKHQKDMRGYIQARAYEYGELWPGLTGGIAAMTEGLRCVCGCTSLIGDHATVDKHGHVEVDVSCMNCRTHRVLQFKMADAKILPSQKTKRNRR